jgi:hypothetical protein
MLRAGLYGMVVVATWAVGNGFGDHKQESMEAALHRPDELKWRDGPPSLPPGAKIAVLEGDPTKPGPFVFRVKVPDGYKIPPHTHPKPERVTVIAGIFNLGMGDKFDATKTEALPAAGQLHEIAYDFMLFIRMRPDLNTVCPSHISAAAPLAHSRVGFDNVPLHPPGALSWPPPRDRWRTTSSNSVIHASNSNASTTSWTSS